MNVGDLIAALQKYDSKTILLVMRCDDDGPYHMQLESVVEVHARRYEHGDDWNIRPKISDKGIVKTLLLE